MKFSLVLAFVAAATAVSAETNAQRLARGAPPAAPALGRRASNTENARRSSPSGSPGECSTGPSQCCSSIGNAGEDDQVDSLLELVGHSAAQGTPCGVSCSPMSVVGIGGGASCNQEPVCCSNNDFTGIINIGCSPINIYL